MTYVVTPAHRAVFRAAGQKGGRAPGKNTGPARIARLVAYGAEVDAHGALVPGPTLEAATARMMADVRLKKAQAALRRSKRQKGGA